jgi:hypothetical protein
MSYALCEVMVFYRDYYKKQRVFVAFGSSGSKPTQKVYECNV